MLVIVLACLVAATSAQSMVQQCLCSDVDSCLSHGPQQVLACADKCQRHISAMGADYFAVKQCIMSHQNQIENAAACVKARFGKTCTDVPGPMVPKRYAETTQVAAFTEIQNILRNSGIALSSVSGLMQRSRKAASCMMKCAKKAKECGRGAGTCGLQLPTDTEMVQTTKQCGIEAGFNTFEIRNICNCLVGAGLQQLAPYCDRINLR